MTMHNTSELRFYGQFEVPVDRFIFERYFPNKQGGFFIECGAFDGQTECSCKFFEESRGWTGLNLEPVPQIFAKLQANRPHSRNLNVGLSATDTTVGFDRVHHPRYGWDTTIGSVSHAPQLREELAAEGCTFEHIEIKVVRWRTLVKREKLTHVDLMVLDVEGHEMSVLGGMFASPVLPSIMCVEYGHIGLDNLKLEMAALGYVFDTLSFANAFFIRKADRDLYPARDR